MKDNVLVILSCETDNPNRAARAVFFAAFAHREGKNITLFLLDDGVYVAHYLGCFYDSYCDSL